MSIGIIVEEISSNSHDYIMINSLNEISKNYDCCIFTNIIKDMPIKNNFAILQMSNAFNHTGTLISTNIVTTQILCNCLMAKNKYYYINSLEWPNVNNLKNSSLHKIYYNNEIELIASSRSHFNLLSKLFKKPSHVISLWDHEKIGELLK